MNWLKVRDKNSTFFLKFASQRRSWNCIQALKDLAGRSLAEEGKMEKLARDYFSELFRSNGVNNLSYILSGNFG